MLDNNFQLPWQLRVFWALNIMINKHKYITINNNGNEHLYKLNHFDLFLQNTKFYIYFTSKYLWAAKPTILTLLRTDILIVYGMNTEGIMSALVPRYCISRFPFASELTSKDYDISSVLETVDFSDGSSQSLDYCSPIEGQSFAMF